MEAQLFADVVIAGSLTVKIRCNDAELFATVRKHLERKPTYASREENLTVDDPDGEALPNRVVVTDHAFVDESQPGRSREACLSGLPAILLLENLAGVDLPALFAARRWQGIVLTQGIPDELHRAIEVVGSGGCWLAPSVVAWLKEANETQHGGHLLDATDCLTPMEETVVRFVVSGLSNSEVAAALHVSPTTVRTHLRAVFRKTGCANRHQLTARVHGAHAAVDPPLRPGR